MNLFQQIFYLVTIYLNFMFAEIHINSIELRPPKWHDIGLIFDVNIINTMEPGKDTLEVRISGAKCCLNISKHDQLCNINRVVGGYFGPLEAGEAMTVSVVLPTVTLYNRVGNCLIGVMSLNASEFKKKIVQQIPFNTSLDYGSASDFMKIFVNGRNFSQCETRDLDPFNNCKPVNCEEKYFGKRSFFHNEKNLCIAVPNCTGDGIMYDIYENECIDTKNFFTERDIEMIQKGGCDNHTWNLKRSVENKGNPRGTLDKSESGKVDLLEEKRYRRVTWEEFSHAVLVIFATIGIYLIICFIIFLIIAWMSRRNSMRVPSDISFDCPGSKSGMSLEITRRDVSERVCNPYPDPEDQEDDRNRKGVHKK